MAEFSFFHFVSNVISGGKGIIRRYLVTSLERLIVLWKIRFFSFVLRLFAQIQFSTTYKNAIGINVRIRSEISDKFQIIFSMFYCVNMTETA